MLIERGGAVELNKVYRASTIYRFRPDNGAFLKYFTTRDYIFSAFYNQQEKIVCLQLNSVDLVGDCQVISDNLQPEKE